MLAGQIRTAIEQLHTKLQEVAAFTATQRELADAEAKVEQLRAKLAALAHADEPQPARSTPAKPAPAAAAKTPLEARQAAGPAPAAASSAAANGKDIRYSTAVRDWARSRGMQVATNGRIADTIISAYLAAHR